MSILTGRRIPSRWGPRINSGFEIFHSMSVFTSDEFADRCRLRLAEYLLLDAVIGNVDRHHENWGILGKDVDGSVKGRLAPTFDHASSLGRELLDTGRGKSRHRILNESRDIGTELNDRFGRHHLVSLLKGSTALTRASRTFLHCPTGLSSHRRDRFAPSVVLLVEWQAPP